MSSGNPEDGQSQNDLQKLPSTKALPSEVRVLLEKLVEASGSGSLSQEGNALNATIAGVLERYTYSGPTPPPEHLREVENVIPGGADRLLRMAEKNQDHQIAWEMKVLGIEGKNSTLGLWFGMFALILLVGAALISLVLGATGVALALVGTTALGLIPAFIKGRGLLNFWSKTEKDTPGKE